MHHSSPIQFLKLYAVSFFNECGVLLFLSIYLAQTTKQINRIHFDISSQKKILCYV